MICKFHIVHIPTEIYPKNYIFLSCYLLSCYLQKLYIFKLLLHGYGKFQLQNL